MDSFRTEVAMLDKFPCDFVFHFFGACFIPNHVTMVTEFVPYRSLADCIQKRPDPDDRTKAKLMLDAARGISYLHGNGIPHQDVKPDNALVFSLDEVLTVNGELTNFGSLRKVHLLVTNMTFTRRWNAELHGVGSDTKRGQEQEGGGHLLLCHHDVRVHEVGRGVPEGAVQVPVGRRDVCQFGEDLPDCLGCETMSLSACGLTPSRVVHSVCV